MTEPRKLMDPARIEELRKEYQTVAVGPDARVLVSDPEACLYAALTVAELRALLDAFNELHALKTRTCESCKHLAWERDEARAIALRWHEGRLRPNDRRARYNADAAIIAGWP